MNNCQSKNAKQNYYFYYTAAFVFFVFLIHCLFAKQLDFGVDEAHYALYGKKIALSYFDHPPLMGWCIAVLDKLVGIDELSLRLMTCALMSITSLLLYRLTRIVFPEEANVGFLSVVLFNSGMMVQLLGWGVVPDVFLMPLLLLIALLIPHLGEKPKLLTWLGLGVLMGLCGLSKYTAIVAPIALVLFAIRRHYFFTWLKQPGAWFAVLLSGLILIPVLVWNAQNDWVSFAYQLNHGKGDGWTFGNLFNAVVSHFVLFSPLLIVVGVSGLLRGSAQNATEQFIRLVFYSYLIMVFWASGNGALLPHWGAVAYLFLAVIASKHINYFYQGVYRKVVLGGLVVLSAVLVLVLYFVMACLPVRYGLHSIYYDVLGWKQAGERVKELSHQYDVKQILVTNWTHASRIAWYSKTSPVRVLDDKPNQYDVWYGEPKNVNSLIVVPTKLNGKPSPLGEVPYSFKCKAIDESAFILKEKQIIGFTYYFCNT